MCQIGELFRSHILGHPFYRLPGIINAITLDMFPNFLLREFQHYFVCSSDASIIHHGIILVLDKEVITLILYGRGVGVLFVYAVTVIMLLTESQQSLVITFVFEFIELNCVIRRLEIGYGRIKHLFLWGNLILLLHTDIPLQILGYLIYLLRNQRRRSFYIQQRSLDVLRRLFQLAKPPFEVSATILLDMLRHTVTLCDQRTAEFGHQFLAGILLRPESCRLDSVKDILRTGRMRHLVKKSPVERLPGLELLLFRHDDFILRDRVVCAILMQRFDRANPKIVLYHRIDRCEAEMLPILDFWPCVLLLQLFPQIRSSLPQVGLRNVEHPEHFHFGIDVILLLLVIGEFLVVVILDLLLRLLVYARECSQHHRERFLATQHGDAR